MKKNILTCLPRAINQGVYYINAFTLNTIKFYSSNSSNVYDDGASTGTPPVKFYFNTDTQKLDILKENQNKCGVYRWINTLKGESYIGSSIDISKRLSQYFNYNYLIDDKNKRMIICKSLLKNGYSNFALEILEYCDKSVLIEREQFYLDLLKPEYNVLKIAGSTLGFKHSESTIEKMKNAKKGNKNYTYGTKRLEEIKN
jgi:hypothetical protein